MASNETKATNGLNVNGANVISPELSEAELLWVREYGELEEKKEGVKHSIRSLGRPGNETSLEEANAMRKEILDIEYQQRLHVESGSKSEHTFREAIKEEYYIPMKQEKIGDMFYNNYGSPPQPDVSDPAVAHKDWVLEKAQHFRDNLQHVKEGIGEAVDASKPYAREAFRAVGSAAIDSVGPTPSKLLPLPKTPHPHMDFLRDGTMDDAASRAGIKTPGGAVMDKVLGPPPTEHKGRPDTLFDRRSSGDELERPSGRSTQMVDAFRHGDPRETIKEFPSLASAYGAQAAAYKQIETNIQSPWAQQIAMERVDTHVANSILAENVPVMKINETTHQASQARGMELELRQSVA